MRCRHHSESSFCRKVLGALSSPRKRVRQIAVAHYKFLRRSRLQDFAYGPRGSIRSHTAMPCCPNSDHRVQHPTRTTHPRNRMLHAITTCQGTQVHASCVHLGICVKGHRPSNCICSRCLQPLPERRMSGDFNIALQATPSCRTRLQNLRQRPSAPAKELSCALPLLVIASTPMHKTTTLSP